MRQRFNSIEKSRFGAYFLAESSVLVIGATPWASPTSRHLRHCLLVERRLGATVGGLAAVGVGPLEQLLHQLARFPRRPIGLARGGRRRLCFGQRSVAMGARMVGPRGDPVGEPPPEPLPTGGLRGGLDPQRRSDQPARAQVVARRAKLDLQPLLRLLRCSAPMKGARQHLGGGVLGGLPDREKSLQRVWTGH